MMLCISPVKGDKSLVKKSIYAWGKIIQQFYYLWVFILVAISLGCVIVPSIVNAEEISNYTITTIAEGLDKPYSLAFLPNGDVLVTEKANRLRIIRDGKLLSTPVKGVSDVFVTGHYNGLLDIALHPRFEENHLIYLSFTFGREEANATRVVRVKYIDGRLEDTAEVFTAYPMKDTLNHPGGHLTFLKDETLLITVGDGYEYREKAQDLESMLGKIVRVTDNGKVPDNNPFTDATGAPSPIWSYGHRHPQGIVYDFVGDVVYAHEHGPRGGDEINMIKRGKNYGWPIATYGLDYSGAYISPYKEYPGTEQPLVQWTPSLAPSGITQCRGCLWPEWEGSLFIGMLAGQQVVRVSIENGVAVQQKALFKDIGERIRNVRFGLDRALYIITEASKSKVLRVEPSI